MQQAPFTLNELLHPALWLLWVLGASKPIVSPAEEATGLALDNGHRGAAPPLHRTGFYVYASSERCAGSLSYFESPFTGGCQYPSSPTPGSP